MNIRYVFIIVFAIALALFSVIGVLYLKWVNRQMKKGRAKDDIKFKEFIRPICFWKKFKKKKDDQEEQK